MHDRHASRSPAVAADRRSRHRALLQLVLERDFGTQHDLVEALEAAGHAVTQSSVSRDIRDLGLEKRDGVYRASRAMLAGPAGPAIWTFVEGLVPAGPHLLVVNVAAATAQAVAAAVDVAGWTDVAGTVAGDDTVFVAIADDGDRALVVSRIRTLAELD